MNSKYKVDILLVVAIFMVMFLPYFVIGSAVFGTVESTTTLAEIDNYTKQLTPIVIGLLCGIIVYRAIQRTKEVR